MKISNQYTHEKLIVISPKTFDELRKIVDERYNKLGHGTKQKPIDFNDIDVSNLDSFCSKYDTGIFEYTRFKYIDISDWDVSNIKSMSFMFFMCTELKSVGNISKWNVSKVTDMNSMFHSYKYFNQDISGWNVANVTDMAFMFKNCNSFNQDISSWDVSKVRYKIDMFDNCPIKEEYKPKFK